jgi:hypothetical protein
MVKQKSRGGSKGGGSAPGARPLKLEKNKIFWRKIVIFHTKYLKFFRVSLRSAQFFQVHPPNLKSWIRPWRGQMYKQRSTKHYTEKEKHELHYFSLEWAQVLRNTISLHQT